MNKINFINCKSYDQLSKQAANEFVKVIKEKPNAVLGLATGSSPIGTYQELIKAFDNQVVSFKNCYSFNLDEYVGLSPKYENQSYHYFMNQNLFSQIDIDLQNTFFPINPFEKNKNNDFAKYDSKISNYSGLDLLILGIGNNGHIGFNEPGSSLNSRTRIINLTESTIKANSRFFEKVSDVPKQAVTMGLATILEAKKIILIVVGASKQEALSVLKLATEFDSNWPCTALVKHNDVKVYYID